MKRIDVRGRVVINMLNPRWCFEVTLWAGVFFCQF
uniref:Uncharacterized protein n=1 Tax=Rhizophora mucronata TaxID=61149 RepID=A0A2P2QCQ8_RHIMU